MGALTATLTWLAPCATAQAADANEITELKRAIDELRAENRALAQRLLNIEAQRPGGAATASGPNLDQRLKELELGKTAQEDAVRAIIRDSVSSLGSKINDAVSFGGTLDITASRNREFSGERKSSLGFSGLSLEFDVQVNPWARGHFKLESINATGVPAPTATRLSSNIDRITVDTAYIALGDQQRFPLLLSAGRMVLPFGISTGHPVADVLSIDSPLTVAVFETRANALALNFAFPTPALTPPTPAVVAPLVRPLVLGPLVDALGRRMGYSPPPARIKPPSPVSFTPPQPPINAGLFFYEGLTVGGIGRHVGATAGYHAKGHCGKNYDELANSALCPWAFNIDFNYNSSIFNSRFLQAEYQDMLDRVGRIPAVAGSIKAAFGPFALVGEWNGATKQARFTDDAGQAISIKPTAWQLSLGWQANWNPWVQEIGAQGSYLAIGYSQSRDLAGVIRLVDGTPTRIGFVPRRRLLLTAGEWVADGLRVAVELSRNWDYPLAEGGTGKSANGVATTLTYVW